MDGWLEPIAEENIPIVLENCEQFVAEGGEADGDKS